VRGSITGTRQDLREALQLAGEGKVSAVVESEPLAEVNSAIAAIREGRVKGRIVLRMT
jgi:alcohol dehydrogenase, propanol-preferring